MNKIGVHLFIQKGLEEALKEAHRLGCQTFQIFSKSPRSWYAPALNKEKTKRFSAMSVDLGMDSWAIHASYLINLASPKPDLWQRSVEALAHELVRAGEYGAPFLVVHVGSSSTESDREKVLERVGQGVRQALKKAGETGATLLLENMAAERGDVGSTFEELKILLDLIDAKDHLGICLDTCHAFAAGYDIRDAEGVGRLAGVIDQTVGWPSLKLVHANDSKKPLSCHVDRHQHIDQGFIGKEGFRSLLNHPQFGRLPFVLETPKDSPQADETNISLLRHLARNSG
ncbi:MAG: deoxyribonuclease IV [Elusimicrobia bacterium]|nr:deoxyribonuclease IV [Elusimicrobiota bacterium]